LLSFEVFMEMSQFGGERCVEFVVWAMPVPDCILLFIDNLLRVYIRGLMFAVSNRAQAFTIAYKGLRNSKKDLNPIPTGS
jgi:hypothetical protein